MSEINHSEFLDQFNKEFFENIDLSELLGEDTTLNDIYKEVIVLFLLKYLIEI